jgi:hypothetical protein
MKGAAWQFSYNGNQKRGSRGEARKNPACAGCNVTTDDLIAVLYLRAAHRPSLVISAGSP